MRAPLIFREDADLYHHARTSHQLALISDVVGLVDPAARALDLGFGIGKVAVLLAVIPPSR